MYILYFNVYVATWNEIFISCDQWKWILSDLMWPLSQKLWPFWYSSCNCFISLRVNQFNDDVIVWVDTEVVISFWVKKFLKIERKDKINDSFGWGLFYFRSRMRNMGGSQRRPKKSKEILKHECRSMKSWDGLKFVSPIFINFDL